MQTSCATGRNAPRISFTSRTDRTVSRRAGDGIAPQQRRFKLMRSKRLSLLFLAVTFSASAQTPAQPLRLTLDDAIHMALGNGTQAELARSNEQMARIAR